MDNTKCLIVLDGNIPKKIIKALDESKGIDIIAADGAANVLYHEKIKPGYITGDFDSIKPGVVAHYKNKNVKVMQVKEQEHNDFEKCLMLAESKNYRDVIVIGMTGKRFDHAVNNLSIMKRYSDKMNIIALDKTFEIFFIKGKYSSEYKNNETVSLFGLPFAKGIITEGLAYSLSNEDLEFGIREGALNICSSDNISLSVVEGSLLIFKKHFGRFKDYFSS